MALSLLATLAIFSSAAVYADELTWEGRITAVLQNADDSRVDAELTASADLFLTLPRRNGEWLLYIEASTTPDPNGVSAVYPTANADAGPVLNRDGDGSVQISEFNYTFHLEDNRRLMVGLVNPSAWLDRSRITNDENTHFINGSSKNNATIEFPDYTLGAIMRWFGSAARSEIALVVTRSDGIDLHTGAINRSNLPQIRANLDDPETLEIARAFGVPVIINSDIRDGSLRACAHDRGMPVLIYEAGEALRFDEVSIRAGIRGILNVMRHIGMLPKLKNPKEVTPVIARSTSWVRAPSSGIVTAKIKLGNSVRKDQSLASISTPLGDEEDHVIAPFDGIVIGKSKLPLAHEGDALFHLGAFKSIPRVENLVENFAAEHDDGPIPT